MKSRFSLFAMLVLVSCTTQKMRIDYSSEVEYEHYYYSQTAYDIVERMIKGGVKPKPNHTTIDGAHYTCMCDLNYFKQEYSKRFPDAVLVKVLPKGTGKVQIHY